MPPLSLLALVVVRTAETDKVAAQTTLIDNAKVIASMVHGALLSDAQTMETIGGYASSSADDPETELALASKHFRGEATLVPADAALDHWTVSNLVDIRPGESARLVFNVPIKDGKGEALKLTADSTAVSNKISFGKIENQTLVAVVDGNGNMITRSAAAAENLGKRVPTWEALLEVGAPTGRFDAVAFDGTPISFGFASIEGTPGWVVVVGMPKAVLDGRWQNPLKAFGIGVLVALIVAVLLAFILSRKITGPIEAMVARSHAIGRDSKSALPDAPDAIVQELHTLYRAQMNSHERLIQRGNELELSSKRYRAVSKVGAMVTWRADVHGNAIDVEGWEEFTGQRTVAALGRGWVEQVHPEDMPVLNEALALAAQTRAPTVTAEARVKNKNQKWIWVNFRGAVITDTEGEPAEWVGTLEDIDDRKRLQLRISHMAYHDALTGLPNRVRLAEHFEQMQLPQNAGHACALLYIDLDKFKQANDTFGHAAGDALLKDVGARLNNILRETDLVARLGGDEFAVVLSHFENVEYSTMVATRIVKTLSTPFEIEGNTIQIGASVGIAVFTTGQVSIERLQFEADRALYRAKSGGRNRWSFDTSEDDDGQIRA
ncbi:diguanylate cyclase [Devosia sp.]|uniref:diguanylate cyclase domain-containing protein n=1 Tax=Devosia sp. TaxID=1871048 RepID=UPI001AD4B61D|nr:diguanylate cyclase [Devosia sp.]MBN9332849.1 diguanylate cyclase [Devosia sp.]